MSNVKRIAFTVHGTVQGVGFRDFVQRKATSYGLTGYVKNTPNGKVAGEAQGDEGSLKKLKADLNDGPRLAHVVKLETKELDPKEGESSFEA
ncbi:acylphosphatase [Capronia coronata CBS 617.96]|uniref:Acylphosphatase n=1 Tax=Capronia coronata CBS 617.96 TaxID=1182541 RepID=W9YS46_9EURO|nr:acylphosphatase [Capronia coronata CBS 617.96]EXJ95333.1 acylphosphatase [Capronia coronata CBS 617.96]